MRKKGRGMQGCQCCQPGNLGEVLLEDIRELSHASSFISTEDLVASLIDHNPDQWSAANHYGRDLTPQRMGRLLAGQFGIKSTRNSASKRGYCTSVFQKEGVA